MSASHGQHQECIQLQNILHQTRIRIWRDNRLRYIHLGNDV